MADPASPGFVLPQFQGNLYDIQTKQALAQALLQKGIQGNAEAYKPAGGGYQYVPQMGIGGALSNAANLALGAYLQKQAGQDLTGLGAAQWSLLTGDSMPTAASSGPTGEQLGAALGGGGGPTNANAAALSQAMQPQQTQARVAPLQPGGALNPAGLPVGVAAQEYLRDPAAYSKEFIAPFYKPTEATQLGRQANLTPQQIQSANQGILTQKQYIAPLAGGAGQVYRDPTNPSRVLAQNPNIGEGMQPAYDAQGNFIGTIPIPGYAGAVEGIAGAKARGAAQGETQQIFNPATQQMEIVPKSSVLGGGGSSQGGLGTGRLGTSMTTGGGTGGIAAAPALGAQAAMEAEGKSQVEQGMRTQELAGGAPNQRLFLGELRQTLGEFNSGDPNADWKLTAKKLANANSPFGNVFDPKKIASQEMFNKAAGQLAMEQFRNLGSGGANSTLETAIKTNPNQALSTLGNKGIIDLLSGNVDAQERKGDAWQAWKEQNGPGSYSKFQTEWNKKFDPRVFMIPYQSKDEAMKMVNSMPENERKAFQQKFNFAVQNGWIQLPGQ